MEKILIIQGRLAGLNDYTSACRTNPHAGAKMKKDAERLISAYIMQQLKGVEFEGQVELRFDWYEKNKRRDLDNICFAKKFIFDALVSNYVIEADGWRGVKGFTDRFFVDAENPRIEVFIYGETRSN